MTRGRRKVARALRKQKVKRPSTEQGARRTWLVRAARAIGVLALVALSVGGVADVWRFIHCSPRFAVRDIQLQGLKRLTKQEVLEVAGVRVGQNIFSVDEVEASQRVTMLPRVRRATVTLEVSGLVTITVVEREPVAMVVSGTPLEIDGEGVILGEVPAGEVRPIITFLDDTVDGSPGMALPGEDVGRGLKVLELFQTSPVATWLRVSEVDVRDPDNVNFIMAGSGTEIRWGNGEFESKLRRLEALCDYFQQTNAASPDTLPARQHIDLRFGYLVPSR